MRLCVRAGAWRVLPVLLLLAPLRVRAEPSRERHYYIAAVEIDWTYSEGDNGFGSSYKKVVFREYEKGFKQAKTHPSWLGLLGPTLRAEEGETIVVTFRNMATSAHSIHPHGVVYGKQSEGAQYFDNTSHKEKEDDVVRPNTEHVYFWEATAHVAPQPDDPTCLTYTYISHENVVEDYNSGLIGALLICKPGSLDAAGKQIGVHHEYVFLFGVFHETKSIHKPSGQAADSHVKYTINGYTKGSLPDVSVCVNAPVSLHLLGMSSEPEVFSVHVNGHVLQQTGHKVSSVGLISGSTATASMKAPYAGRWMLSSHTSKHLEAGMRGYVEVKECEGFEAQRDQMKKGNVWTYYIAAEEVVWDYAPQIHSHVDEDFKRQYLQQSATRIGPRYKKAKYVLYKNASFTERKQMTEERGILGPVIRAQVRDEVKIVFKNKASRPYSIYPHGLTIEKSQEGANYPDADNQTRGVQPGETRTYVWRVVEEDEPPDQDARCQTRMYHSAVDTPRDIASGLIGPMLICRSESLDVRNVQLKADQEQHAMFAVFDENKSWYLDHNIRQYSDESKVNKADPDFYRSNVMHTINGYAFESGPPLGFCNGEVVTWHLSSIGAQDYIQTATFYGHPFMLNERMEDFLSLYPMTGETITMSMENIGVWLLASLNSHWTTKGMRVKFQDVECFRDNYYDYNPEDNQTANKEFSFWTLPTLDEIRKEEEQKIVRNVPEEPDEDTMNYAEQWGLRSFRNRSTESDEKLDLRFLDYDAIDVPDGSNNTLRFTNDSETSTANVDLLNETLATDRKEASGVGGHLLGQNITAPAQNSSLTNYSDYEKENQTLLFSWTEPEATNLTTDISLNQSIGDNKTWNSSVESTDDSSSVHQADRDPDVLSHLDDMRTSDTNTTAAMGSVTTETSNLTRQSAEANLTVTATGAAGNVTAVLDVEELNETLIGDTQTAMVEEALRGDVFSYSVPVEDDAAVMSLPGDYVSVISLSQRQGSETGTQYDTSTDATNQVLPKPTVDVNVSSTNTHNFTIFDLEPTDNGTGDNELKYRPETNSSEAVLPGPTQASHSPTEVTSGSNASVELSSQSRDNVTLLIDKLNHTSPATVASSESTATAEEHDELFIYLKEKNTEGIKTTSVKVQSHNWTYEGSHRTEPMDIPDYMVKYFEDKTPTNPPPPKKNTVPPRQRPEKDGGQKTLKRKIYKPRLRSALPFSPRGFNPGMSPRGSRPSAPKPVSDKEELVNMTVVIGVPRFGFRDYDLYVPGSSLDHVDLERKEEYVSYKDPYGGYEDMKKLKLDDTTKYYLKHPDPNVKTYFIAAEEVEWDYAGYGQRRQEKSHQADRETTTFTKVIFRGYLDSSFSTPDIRGELEEHLGILGPVIKAEVGQSIVVVFRNKANRPFSLHPNGVSYTKNNEGLSYDDGSKHWITYDNEVLPNTTFTYFWTASAGPTPDESNCRTWAYYSGVNPERDIHSGLIGPLLVCREGTLDRNLIDTREFVLLFMTFDESQSWFYEKNQEMIQRRKQRRNMNSNFDESLKFPSINGITFNLKGLRMYTDQLVTWHLLSMGSPTDLHSIHFHGQTFLHKMTASYRQAVYPLLPGSFATLEMRPSKPGLWQLETEVGSNQQKGMQTLFLVLDNDCYRPLGLESGSVKDAQIRAIHTRASWEPSLARLNNHGQYNAWSTEANNSWIQVDFQRPVVISQVATQGAKQLFQSQHVLRYLVSYSNDQQTWVFYKGDSRDLRKVFSGNLGSHDTKVNTFFPPIIGRFIRLHPITWYNKATVRMEFYGCELDGCSVPLGMESGLIEDRCITASSTASSWYGSSWKPYLARLNRQGTINAWQAKHNDMNQWLQVELPKVTKITGIITQGAKALGKMMYVTSYSLQFSNNGINWSHYTDDEKVPFKTFLGNTNNSDHVRNYIYPPIFSRFIRIVPRSWKVSLTMRVELLGCDFE